MLNKVFTASLIEAIILLHTKDKMSAISIANKLEADFNLQVDLSKQWAKAILETKKYNDDLPWDA